MGEDAVAGEGPVDTGLVVVGVERGFVGSVTPVPVRADRCVGPEPSWATAETPRPTAATTRAAATSVTDAFKRRSRLLGASSTGGAGAATGWGSVLGDRGRCVVSGLLPPAPSRDRRAASAIAPRARRAQVGLGVQLGQSGPRRAPGLFPRHAGLSRLFPSGDAHFSLSRIISPVLGRPHSGRASFSSARKGPAQIVQRGWKGIAFPQGPALPGPRGAVVRRHLRGRRRS